MERAEVEGRGRPQVSLSVSVTCYERRGIEEGHTGRRGEKREGEKREREGEIVRGTVGGREGALFVYRFFLCRAELALSFWLLFVLSPYSFVVSSASVKRWVVVAKEDMA